MKNKKIFFNISLLLVFFIMGIVLYPILTIKAAALTTARDYLNRNQENLTTGVTHEIIITPATNVSGGAGVNVLSIIFPDGDDGNWCRGTGSLTTATSSLKESATALPGTLVAACAQGSGGSSYDTITITGVNNLTAGTIYGVKISGNAAALGTPANTTTGVITIETNNGTTDVDSSNVTADIIASDQVTISGQVDSTLTFAIDDTAIGFGSITSSSVRYATDDASGSASEDSSGDPVQLTASTNADDGLVIEIRDLNSNSTSGLYSADSGTTLASVASTLVSAGSEEFGVYAKNASSLTIAEGFDNDSDTDVSISTSFQTIASTTAPVSSGTVDIQPLAAIAATTPSGSYADTLTIIATGKF